MDNHIISIEYVNHACKIAVYLMLYNPKTDSLLQDIPQIQGINAIHHYYG